MQKMLSVLVGVTLLAPVSVFASMNYVGASVGYKQPAQCTSGDALLQEFQGGNYVVTGCWTQEAIQYASSEASKRTMPVATGASVTLKDGSLSTCPWWFSTGCVIDPSIVR